MNPSFIFLKNVLFVLLAINMSSCSADNPEDPNTTQNIELKSQYAKFTFDYGVKGISPIEMTNIESSAGTITIESDPENSANQCLVLEKTTTLTAEQLISYKDFLPIVKGTVSVEAKIRMTDALNRKQFSLFANSSTEIAGIAVENGQMITATDHPNQHFILISSVLINHWYSVKLSLDLSSKTYDVFVDGIKMTKKPIDWKNKSIAPGQFSKMEFQISGSPAADMLFVDQVTIMASDIPGLVFNSGIDKTNNTSARLVCRTCPTLYYISLPVGWTPEKKWPVFMYNIREGWDGPSPNDGPQIFAQKRGNMPFIIVSVKTKSIVGSDNGYPQKVLDYCNSTSDQLFDEIAVIELFKQIKEDYNGEDKFYWDGFSASGHAFWPLVMWKPEFIAAACCSACNYLGTGGPDPSDLGRGMTSKGVSNAPERITLPVKQYTGENDGPAQIGITTGKGMWQQFMNAKATCEAHGYTNVSLDILPGVGHAIHFDAELSYFYNHYLSTHKSQ